MGRPGKKGLPPYLTYDSTDRVYKLTLTNGKRRSLGKNKHKAVMLTNAYNAQMRPGISIDSLLDITVSTERPTSSELLRFDDIHNAILRKIKLGDAKQRELANDISRAKSFFTMPASDIDIGTLQEYLTKHHDNLRGEPLNKKITFLKRLFSFAKNLGQMKDVEDPALSLIPDQKSASGPKKRRRLSVDGFKAVYAIAPLYMQTAMDLALQLTQGREEIRKINYRIKENDFESNGCVWFKEPVNGIYGTLYIHRKKVEDHEAAHIAVPIGNVLKEIIDRSRDGILCPYVVHKRQLRKPRTMSKEKSHHNQLRADELSKEFTTLVNACGFYDKVPEDERPTFHEMRALGAYLIKEMGIDPQARLAHTDPESTKLYVRGHVEMVQVQHVELVI